VAYAVDEPFVVIPPIVAPALLQKPKRYLIPAVDCVPILSAQAPLALPLITTAGSVEGASTDKEAASIGSEDVVLINVRPILSIVIAVLVALSSIPTPIVTSPSGNVIVLLAFVFGADIVSTPVPLALP
jgi:hypothetical protein